MLGIILLYTGTRFRYGKYVFLIFQAILGHFSSMAFASQISHLWDMASRNTCKYSWYPNWGGQRNSVIETQDSIEGSFTTWNQSLSLSLSFSFILLLLLAIYLLLFYLWRHENGGGRGKYNNNNNKKGRKEYYYYIMMMLLVGLPSLVEEGKCLIFLFFSF